MNGQQRDGQHTGMPEDAKGLLLLLNLFRYLDKRQIGAGRVFVAFVFDDVNSAAEFWNSRRDPFVRFETVDEFVNEPCFARSDTSLNQVGETTPGIQDMLDKRVLQGLKFEFSVDEIEHG